MVRTTSAHSEPTRRPVHPYRSRQRAQNRAITVRRSGSFGAPMVLGRSRTNRHQTRDSDTRTPQPLSLVPHSGLRNSPPPGPADTLAHCSGRTPNKSVRLRQPLRSVNASGPSRLRIRRLGVRIPSGALRIKAATSRNVGYGLDCFPGCAAIFHIVGASCPDGAPMSACRLGGGSCRTVLTSASPCRLVWIMVGVPVGRSSISVHCGRTSGSSRSGGWRTVGPSDARRHDRAAAWLRSGRQ